jgi:hypothetical protein
MKFSNFIIHDLKYFGLLFFKNVSYIHFLKNFANNIFLKQLVYRNLSGKYRIWIYPSTHLISWFSLLTSAHLLLSRRLHKSIIS